MVRGAPLRAFAPARPFEGERALFVGNAHADDTDR